MRSREGNGWATTCILLNECNNESTLKDESEGLSTQVIPALCVYETLVQTTVDSAIDSF